jgi:hypothetical protein
MFTTILEYVYINYNSNLYKYYYNNIEQMLNLLDIIKICYQ